MLTDIFTILSLFDRAFIFVILSFVMCFLIRCYLYRPKGTPRLNRFGDVPNNILDTYKQNLKPKPIIRSSKQMPFAFIKHTQNSLINITENRHKQC